MRIGKILVDLNIIVKIINGKNKKFLIFAGTSHSDAVIFLLKKYLGYKEIYSTDSHPTKTLEKKYNQCLLGTVISIENDKNIIYYLVCDLPKESGFNFIL